MLRIALSSAFALCLAGCAAQTQMVWSKGDGPPPTPTQFELDKVACEGEVQRANLGAGNAYCRGIAGCAVTGIVRGVQLADVRKGCMAAKGYLLVPDPNAPAPTAAAIADVSGGQQQ